MSKVQWSVASRQSDNLRPLPEGWAWTTLGKSCDIVLGQSPSSDTYNTDGNGLPFYQGKTEFGDLYPIPVKWCSSPKKIAEENDILITVRAPVGPTNLCPEKSCIGRGLAAIRPRNGMPTKFILYYLRYIEREWDSKATGTTFKAITGYVLRNQEMPLPPLPEQERIVARLEELLSDLEAGVAALERVRAGVKRYKASVLKAACEGKIFESRGTENSETGLPDGWRVVKIGSVFDVKIGSTPSRSKPEYWGGNIHWVSSGEVRNMRIKETRELITDEGFGNRKKLYPPGTVLLAMIGEGKTRGQAAILDIEAATNQNIAAILPNQDETVPEWVFYWLISRYEETRKSGVGGMQYALNSERVRNFDIPLPPLEEQRRIAAEVERRLESARAVEAAVEAGLKRAGRLRQAVLRSAFEGRLVSQTGRGK